MVLKMIPSPRGSSLKCPSPSEVGRAGIACARRRGLLAKFGSRGGVRRRAGMQSRGARGVGGVGGLTCHWPRAREKEFF